MEYVCRVGTPTGDVVERTFSAADETALRAELEQQGYYLFGIRRGLQLGSFRLKRRVPTTTLLLFAQELAALLKAGLPLLQSLDVMLERQKEPVFRRSLSTVRDRVKGGTSLSEAFQAEAALYPPIFSASLVAGERSGSLEQVLRRLAQYLKLNEALKKKVISASVYPVVLLSLMGGLVTVLLVKVIPAFQGFYEGFGAELPWATRSLMSFSVLVKANFPYIAMLSVAAVMLTVFWYRRPGSAVLVDRLLLRVPLVGRMMRIYATSQLARTLSTLLAGGLPLLTALEVASVSIGNRALAAAIASATPQIREGRSLTTALETSGMVDNLTLEMVKVGEQTGALGDMLNAVAEFYDEELEMKIAATLALIEPVMLVLLATVVAAMLLAFYLPLFQIFTVIQQRG
jgi:type IV pilus assembly protein PilC